VLNRSCLLVLHTDVNILVQLVQDLDELFDLLSSFLEVKSCLLVD